MQRVEPRDVLVGPARRFERKHVTDTTRDVDLGALMEIATTDRVACADHAVLVSPEDERRDVA